MRTLSFIFCLLFIAFSCQPSSQKKETNRERSVKKDSSIFELKSEIKYNVDSSDIRIYEKLISFAKLNQLATKSFSEIEIEIAHQLLGTPYVSKTLEKDSVEDLVINLRELDCTTFMENVLAISLCIKNDLTGFESYCSTLKQLRYRDGKIDQYPSRLHYTTDWLLDNQKKGIIKMASEEFGTSDFDANVNFMSGHPENYKQLSNPEFVEAIRQHEIRISSSKLKLVPKEKINEVAKSIKDGDMIAISSTTTGLDFSHVAIASWHNKHLHFIHASSKEKKVVLSDNTLHDYLAGMKNNDGIIVARLIETIK